jgi:hypothetical protein
MTSEPNRPLSLRFCEGMISLAARLVPEQQRQDWKREWCAEAWHRWQFLFHVGEWNGREALRLIRNCLGAFFDAAWHLTSQETLQNRIRERLRSPWTCLGVLGVLLLVLATATSGFPATRDLFAFRTSLSRARLVFIWLHPSAGGGDQGLPSDLPPAWRWRSQLLESVTGFSAGHQTIQLASLRPRKLRLVTAERNLFQTLEVRPALGSLPGRTGVVLTDAAWRLLFYRDAAVIGARIRIGGEAYRVTAVLPASFHFLTREPTAYLLKPFIPAYPPTRVMVVARMKPGVTEGALDRELTKIAETATYYFFKSELRYSSFNAALWTPLFVFGIATLLSALFVTVVSRVRIRRFRLAFQAGSRRTTAGRVGFFIAKTGAALLLVFLAGLEWTRSESAVIFASWDPANGPFLVWLYILCSMGVLLWSLADQRARCRVCLRLLCFPVRIGCPGCLLLDWSGTELLCTEGHGVLHVPHLSPSWDEESDRWIALDDSWQELFVHSK